MSLPIDLDSIQIWSNRVDRLKQNILDRGIFFSWIWLYLVCMVCMVFSMYGRDQSFTAFQLKKSTSLCVAYLSKWIVNYRSIIIIGRDRSEKKSIINWSVYGGTQAAILLPDQCVIWSKRSNW